MHPLIQALWAKVKSGDKTGDRKFEHYRSYVSKMYNCGKGTVRKRKC
jgi:hypothetical protein